MLLRDIRERLARRSQQKSLGVRKSNRPKLRYFCPSIESLEDRRLLTATLPGPPVVSSFAIAAQVLERSIFYNNSRFDGNNPAASPADDAAIATDKSALLPGEQATFANYTSYSAGINGVMVDIAGLPGTPTAADFVFRVGNSDDPGNWLAAPTPQAISARVG